MSATLGPALVAAAACIVALLGSIHLLYTYWGPKLLPRDPVTVERMQGDTLRITRQTTLWNAWIGFNASHSLGAIVFGVFYAYFALWHADWLAQSLFLRATGLAVLVIYVVLARRYWFSIPLRGLALALVLYAAGLAA
jgi:hypothetical protein